MSKDQRRFDIGRPLDSQGADAPRRGIDAKDRLIERLEQSITALGIGLDEALERLAELERAQAPHSRCEPEPAPVPRSGWADYARRLPFRVKRRAVRLVKSGIRKSVGLGDSALCALSRAHRRRVRSRTLPALPAFDSIQVSIVVPVFNHFAETLACLRSIAGDAGDPPPYEVIVVDDASSDETRELLPDVQNLVYLRNEANLGFIASSNRGAAAARGDFLVFLNNDTVVGKGWLEALTRTFRDFPDAGLAGAKLIYPDGRLQEAGGVVWRDASGWNYGRNDDPSHPRYNFAREVDYCSGACVMVPRSLFERLGGFDAHYSPAYYEDTDLAFKIRHSGHKVIYQPLAAIVHHEGLTSGTSLDSGTKAYQRVNQAKFRARWRDRLATHPEPPSTPPRVVHAGGSGHSPGQVLVVDHMIPMPDRDSGSLRMFHLLRAIRLRGHHVSFAPDNATLLSPYHENLQGAGVEIIHPPHFHSLAGFLRRHGREIDLAVLSRADFAERHIFTVKRLAPQAKVVFDTVDLHFIRERREAEIRDDPRMLAAAEKRRRQELRIAGLADLTLVVSPVEREILLAEAPDLDVRIVSNILDPPKNNPPGFEDRDTIVFIGSFDHPPNRDAVVYFASEIFPLVKRRIPEAVFQIIGSNATPEIRSLESEAIKVLGHVPNVEPLFDRARLSVAPLRFGAGVKGKVNQSMAYGVPTVVTTIAAEGMNLVHGRNSMIADDPETFADAVAQVWNSPEIWRRLSENGLRNLRKNFSVDKALVQIDDLLAWAGLSTPPPAPSRRTVGHGELVNGKH